MMLQRKREGGIQMRRSLTLGMAVFAAALTLAALSSPALAFQYTLNVDHCTGGCGTPPFGTVDVTQVGLITDGKVQITATLATGVNFINTGVAGALGFNIIGNPTIAVTNLTTGFSLLSTSQGINAFDGFGNLDYAIVCAVCGSGAS